MFREVISGGSAVVAVAPIDKLLVDLGLPNISIEKVRAYQEKALDDWRAEQWWLWRKFPKFANWVLEHNSNALMRIFNIVCLCPLGLGMSIWLPNEGWRRCSVSAWYMLNRTVHGRLKEKEDELVRAGATVSVEYLCVDPFIFAELYGEERCWGFWNTPGFEP